MYEIYLAVMTFLYNAVPYVVIIVLALTILNGVRKQMVARRKRLALERHAATHRVAFNTFDVL